MIFNFDRDHLNKYVIVYKNKFAIRSYSFGSERYTFRFVESLDMALYMNRGSNTLPRIKRDLKKIKTKKQLEIVKVRDIVVPCYGISDNMIIKGWAHPYDIGNKPAFHFMSLKEAKDAYEACIKLKIADFEKEIDTFKTVLTAIKPCKQYLEIFNISNELLS